MVLFPCHSVSFNYKCDQGSSGQWLRVWTLETACLGFNDGSAVLSKQPYLIPWSLSWASQVAQWVKHLSAMLETHADVSSIPRSERSPERRRGNPLQYCCLENSMDRGAWWATAHRVTKSWTRLKGLNTHAHAHTHTHTNSNYIRLLLWGLNEIKHMKFSAGCLAYNMYSVNLLLLLHYLSGSMGRLWEYEYNTYSVIATIITLFGIPWWLRW